MIERKCERDDGERLIERGDSGDPLCGVGERPRDERLRSSECGGEGERESRRCLCLSPPSLRVFGLAMIVRSAVFPRSQSRRRGRSSNVRPSRAFFTFSASACERHAMKPNPRETRV